MFIIKLALYWKVNVDIMKQLNGNNKKIIFYIVL